VAGLVAAIVIALPASALAKGPSGSTPSSTLALLMVSDANGDGLPNWNDSVTYKVATTATTQPYVSTQCTQNGKLVLSTSAGFYPSYAWPSAQTVPLSTALWTSGAADCTAKLYYPTRKGTTTLATITFHAGA
jgi:hypothetical protein